LAKRRLRVSWSQKLHDNRGLPKVEKITNKLSKRWGTGTVVIPAPMEVIAIMIDKQMPSFPYILEATYIEKRMLKHNVNIPQSR
jgi:hypothetical protein